MLFLVRQGTQVVALGKHLTALAHWPRGMSDLKLGWHWVRLAITQQGNIQVHRVASAIDKIELPQVKPIVTRIEQYSGPCESLSSHLCCPGACRDGGGQSIWTKH